MKPFRYQALDASGARISGLMKATSLESAVTTLQKRGLLVLRIEAARRASWGSLQLFRSQALPEKALLHFTRQLATLLNAGQPLERSLAILLRQSADRPLRLLIERLRERVKSGHSLSSAMAEDEAFSPFYLSLVRAGEAGGALGGTLSQLSEYLEYSRALRSRVGNAMIYPAFLMFGVLGSLAMLLTYVVPQFVPIFDSLGVPLPISTEVLFSVGQFLAQWGGYLLASLITLLLWFVSRLRAPDFRLAWDRRLLRMRIIGGLIWSLETARLTRTLGTLITQGVPLLDALAIALEVSSNHALKQALGEARARVKGGGSLSEALKVEDAFPDLALQMIQVGEESGQLDGMLLKLADIYGAETRDGIDRLMAALIPLLTLIMAMLVACIMLAIMLPLMNITNGL
ncbi:type II secretion system inner membrane protein GspF [Phytopseudomonas daroniae]|uniref:type II secretion system inner membrane protein GspF n=1 Tax=Phytopseudomonas daroniae TaxID=2487519 RepID=UPI0010385D66|nr:type II secretion system inner membrane protein GspF [Pseudomonas daroniae]TBU74088.1 type II secretion system protein GspF [Pseudomonas daroniae]